MRGDRYPATGVSVGIFVYIRGLRVRTDTYGLKRGTINEGTLCMLLANR